MSAQQEMLRRASQGLNNDLEIKTLQTSRLIYNMNKFHLQLFIIDPGNMILVEHFFQKGGLLITDPAHQKPICRYTELRNLILVGRRLAQITFF